MVTSGEMTPLKDSPNKAFVRSQFCTKIPPFPKDVDLSGQVGIVTGSTTGIGLHCARQLLSLKLTRLIMAVRSLEKGEAVAAKFRAQYPQAIVEVWSLEMSSYDSIRAFVQKADQELQKIDFAILNSAMVAATFRINPSTEHETSVQVNYLSTFLLSILLLPVLKHRAPPSKPGRLTIVGSGVALMSKLPNRDANPFLASFDDISRLAWDPNERYPATKLLGQLVFARLASYISPEDAVVNLVDPGFCKGSGLHREAKGAVGFALWAIKAATGRTLDEGAQTYIDAALVKGKESHGCFVMDFELRPFSPFVYTAEGKVVSERLWEETMREFQFVDARGVLEAMQR